MEIRRTHAENLNKLLALYEAARYSWKITTILINGEILGTFYFEVGIKPTYLEIFDGE